MVVEATAFRRKRFETRLKKRITKYARRGLEKTAEEMVALMRDLVGKDEFDLLNSIGWTWGKPPKGSVAFATSSEQNSLRIVIFAGNESTVVTNKRGVQFQNALIQEFGTAEQPANPFFFPSYRALRKRGRGRVTREIRKAIKEVNNGQ